MEIFLLIILIIFLIAAAVYSRKKDQQYEKNPFRPRSNKQENSFDHALKKADQKASERKKKY